MKNLNARQGYPMLLQLAFTPVGYDKETFVYSGTGIVDITDGEPIKIGDEFKYNNKNLIVTEVIEQREAKGKHPVPAIWQKVKCTYTSSISA